MAELRPYEPSWRDRLAGLMMGDAKASPERRRVVEGLLGSSGLGNSGIGLVDVTPVGGLLGAQEAAKEGDYRGAAMNAMFLGPAAKTANKVALKAAEEMAAKGATREAIWNETGWFKGVDGKWRFEIPDNDIPTKLRPTEEQLFQYPAVNDFVPHKDLFAAYPELKGAKLGPELKDGGSWIADQNVVTVRPIDPTDFSGAPVKNTKSVTLHELQHAVQDKENFARGGNVEMMRDNATARYAKIADAARTVQNRVSSLGEDLATASNFIAKNEGLDPIQLKYWAEKPGDELKKASELTPREQYRRLAGEVEARNVQQRMDMTPDQRRQTPPWLTQDTPDELQIIRGLLGD